ncbi:hypothetical protein SARC_02076 [Sphaeroforma arctica JP610]|uniref:Enoyl-CoA delta isomerase 1, mitochondrial n=1 Tax=Sphaeroforma arctica JP610 TaxID=667725 RepID=A0A0L0G9R6_9EUKA|nr:hypothetical protein SARC_02076 [Sphaeroforma arctica JP610]KNC85772.1 hypothetical protein SARC_02076 [Sphaeroforma arctica JP610]|eukprot:XP_014159674.1 hypothetical protein SARC_02076 [Sphaeroforma arctica JP610]
MQAVLQRATLSRHGYALRCAYTTRAAAATGASHALPLFDNVKLERSGKGTTVLTMCRGPVNSLNMELLQDIDNAIKAAEKDSETKALVITSHSPKVFCAGIDLSEMYRPNPERLPKFWKSLQQMWLTLYGTRLPVIAAITGSAPAGGCLIAMGADYRIMSEGKTTIGLNEAEIGITLPDFFLQPMISLVGPRQTELLTTLGILLDTKEALKIGLIDEVVANDQVLPRALEQSVAFGDVIDSARADTKLQIRKPILDRHRNTLDEDIQKFLKAVNSETTQQMFDNYLAKLQARKKK